ncbi:MAG: hypothetical protein ACSHWN_05920 [Methylophilaceae bacterium]
MKLINAILKHIYLTMQLEHDGSGLPTQFLSASLLVSLYVCLSIVNSANIDPNFLGLGFVAGIYLFVLRTQLVGLIILIGIITNSISLVLGFFGEISALQLVLINALEYLLVYGAVINIIRRYANIT